jgi:transposase
MKPMRVAVEIVLSAREKKTLEQWARSRKSEVRLAQRARMILLAADGWTNDAIAEKVGAGRVAVGRWRNRFSEQRLAGIEKDLPRGGRKARKRSYWARVIVDTTLHTLPQNATHWSTRTLAEYLGISRSMVQRVWKANALKPHLIRTFKVSKDKQFAEKLLDVVGLYLDPPERALVLCCDEKSQIQALDRTQPGLPIKKGRADTMTHDYVRNGTTTLFAALNVAEGKLIGTCMAKHRHQEWLKFLRLIDHQTPHDLELHIIADNYATHKHPKVKTWLAKHPRFHMHFTPTSSSWLNLIERWFAEITNKRIRRGVFKSVQELKDAIYDYISEHNDHPRRFTWTAKAEVILEKYQRARKMLDTLDKFQTA